MKRNRVAYFWAFLATILFLSHFFTGVVADDDPVPPVIINPDTVIQKEVRAGGEAEGEIIAQVTVVEDKEGPDFLSLKAQLNPNTRYTVFLANDPGLGSLPVEFVGEFTTQSNGRGKLKLTTEVINAFGVANQTLEDNEGVTTDPAAGNVGPKITFPANTIPMNFIRIYFAPNSSGSNVFGPSESVLGGGLVGSTIQPLP